MLHIKSIIGKNSFKKRLAIACAVVFNLFSMAPVIAAPPPPPDDPHPFVSFHDGIRFSNPDGSQYAVLHGQVTANTSRFNGGYNTNKFGKGRFGSESEIQTARLALSGQFVPDWTYKFQIASSSVEDDSLFLRQGNLTYTGLPPFNITVGKVAMNYGLDNMHDTYNNYGTGFTMLTGVFTPPPALGITLGNYYHAYGITWNVGVYSFGNVIRNSSSELQGEQGYLQETSAYVGRFGWTLFNDRQQGRVLFWQVSALYLQGSNIQAVDVSADGNVLGTVHPLKFPPVTSGPIAIGAIQKETHIIDIGVATEYGPLSIETEYAHVRTMIGGVVSNHPRYEDGYIQGGWVITGEHRGFDESAGYLVGVTPSHRYGAFEAVVRLEAIRLQSRIYDDERKTGINARTATIGIVWYVNTHVRFAMTGSHMWRWGPGIITHEGKGIVLQGNVFF